MSSFYCYILYLSRRCRDSRAHLPGTRTCNLLENFGVDLLQMQQHAITDFSFWLRSSSRARCVSAKRADRQGCGTRCRTHRIRCGVKRGADVTQAQYGVVPTDCTGRGTGADPGAHRLWTRVREAGGLSAGVRDRDCNMLVQAVTAAPSRVGSMTAELRHFRDALFRRR
jgi:hypothetical protein